MAIQPVLQSLLVNAHGAHGSSFSQSVNAVVSRIDADVEGVWVTADAVYVRAAGVPSYAIGPWNDGNPAVASDRNWLFRVSGSPREQAGAKSTVPLGAIGFYVNGVPIYNAKDGRSYNNEGVWNRNAIVFEADGFDDALGHPSPVQRGATAQGQGFVDGAYHHHQNPIALRQQLGDSGSAHSPILGWSFDGFPVYGPYGYRQADGSGGLGLIRSSYQLRQGTRPSGPGGVYDGSYLEDYQYVADSGDLDEHNGRFSVTPEFPQGVYHYVATMDAAGAASYPYTIGPSYFGVVDQGNAQQAFTLPADAVESQALELIGLQTAASMERLTLSAPLQFGDALFEEALLGTVARDVITGSASAEVLAGGASADQISGGGGGDAFLLEGRRGFGRSAAVVIQDFNAREGDRLVLAAADLNDLARLSFKAVSGNRALRQAAASSKALLYDRSSGVLAFNANGRSTGFGDGGILAVLQDHPTLSKVDLLLL